jgi:uncharacterized membrane protein required for colicin V production
MRLSMWLNALALLVLAACMAAGAWSGALATGLRIATLVLAYGAAATLGPVFAPAIGAQIGVGGVLAVVASGSAVFVATYLVSSLASRYARGLGKRENTGRSPRDRFVGACFGTVRGGLLALMVVYLAMWFDALRATGNGALVPEIGDSIAARVTSGVVQSAIESAVDPADPAARFAARFASRPAVSAVELQEILDDENFARLRNDARFWNEIEDGNLDAALQRSSFVQLADDAQLRQKAAHLGLVSDRAALDAEAFSASIAEVLEQIGPRLRGLRSDPAVQELLADPAVVAALQSGDTVGLLAHPKFRALVTRLSGPLPESGAGGATAKN